MNLDCISKGQIGEDMTSTTIRRSLDPGIYKLFDDVVLCDERGVTQIDHVLVSPFGIFVIETKNMAGWIFGSEFDEQWTQSFPGKKTYRFQNPLRQNYGHIQCLANVLRLNRSLFHSIVYFPGNCEFKTPMPQNVISSNLEFYIKGFIRRCLDEIQIADLLEVLTHAKPAANTP